MTVGNPSEEGTEEKPPEPAPEDRRVFLIGLPDAEGNITGFALAERIWFASKDDLRNSGAVGAATLTYLESILADRSVAPPAPVLMMKQIDDPNGPGVLGFRSLPRQPQSGVAGEPKTPPET